MDMPKQSQNGERLVSPDGQPGAFLYPWEQWLRFLKGKKGRIDLGISLKSVRISEGHCLRDLCLCSSLASCTPLLICL